MSDIDKPTIKRTKAQQFWHKVWGRWWIARTIFSKRFWNEPFKDYPQTWCYMPHWKILKLPIQWFCGVTCKHELSETEWGFGGGDNVDCWCRWCNKMLSIPITEARFRFPVFNAMRPDKMIGNKMIGKEVKEQSDSI